MWKHLCEFKNSKVIELEDNQVCKYCYSDRRLAAQRFSLLVNKQEESKFSIKKFFKKKVVEDDEHGTGWQDRIG